jgi:hypothetical protein
MGRTRRAATETVRRKRRGKVPPVRNSRRRIAHDPFEVAMIVIASLVLLAMAIFLGPKEFRAAAAPSAAAEALTKN